MKNRNIVGKFVIEIIMASLIFYQANAKIFSDDLSFFPVKDVIQRAYGRKLINTNSGLISDLQTTKIQDLQKETSSRIKPVPHPPHIRAVYSTGWVAGHHTLFSRLLGFIDETCINSLVVDIKDDSGSLSYYSNVPLVQTIGAWRQKMEPKHILRSLKAHGVYPIARVVVFKDPVLAEKRPEFAVRNKAGEVWRDNRGLAWVDPHSKEVWDYNIQIAKEAIDLGFPEVQFDYVRFTSDGRISECVYPFAKAASATKAEVIEEFLDYARQELEPLGAVVSADVFGLVCSDPGDLGIGQNLEKLANVVDILSPMVYPSHYYKGTYGIKDPNREPYLTVLQSLNDAQKRLKDSTAKIRPWLQDFSLGSKYGRAEIVAQIKAAKDAGVNDWLFWNPSCRYNRDFYPEEGFSFDTPPVLALSQSTVESKSGTELEEQKNEERIEKEENRSS